MKRRTAALIDESRCIGCTLCIAACPVDAIVGAQRYMHTVVESWCIGCGLCLPPCPVDCIAMVPLPPEKGNWRTKDAQGARRRARLRKARLARAAAPAAPTTPQQRRTVLSAAIAQSRAKRSATRK